MIDKVLALRQATGVDGDGLVQAARYYLAERTDDLDSKEMRREMETATGQAGALSAELQLMIRDSQRMEDAAGALLAWAWDDPAQQPAVLRAIAASKGSLPVVEVGILGMVALYGMFLVVTRGKKTVTTRTTASKGAMLKETTTEYYPHPLSSLVDLFRIGKDSN